MHHRDIWVNVTIFSSWFPLTNRFVYRFDLSIKSIFYLPFRSESTTKSLFLSPMHQSTYLHNNLSYHMETILPFRTPNRVLSLNWSGNFHIYSRVTLVSRIIVDSTRFQFSGLGFFSFSFSLHLFIYLSFLLLFIFLFVYCWYYCCYYW